MRACSFFGGQFCKIVFLSCRSSSGEAPHHLQEGSAGHFTRYFGAVVLHRSGPSHRTLQQNTTTLSGNDRLCARMRPAGRGGFFFFVWEVGAKHRVLFMCGVPSRSRQRSRSFPIDGRLAAITARPMLSVQRHRVDRNEKKKDQKNIFNVSLQRALVRQLATSSVARGRRSSFWIYQQCHKQRRFT